MCVTGEHDRANRIMNRDGAPQVVGGAAPPALNASTLDRESTSAWTREARFPNAMRAGDGGGD